MRTVARNTIRCGLSLGLLALVLTACATQAPVADFAPETVAGDSSPQPVEGYDWFSTIETDGAQLVFGAPDSDDVSLVFACLADTSMIDISSVAEAGTTELYLESGGETERFSGRAEPSLLDDGDLVTASTRIDHPVMIRFRTLGWIAVWTGDQRKTLVPHAAGRSHIDRFFTACA